ncbi:YpjP family protein [Aeribacillus sp. FSL K6-8394]|uniref:YpjP family protein n=1 Tax=Aeribacillus sp. FSL K6-8394 TaxID=2954570 RepID=UPI0030FB0C2B
MKNWIRKSLVVLFTLATFGLVAPPSALTVNKQAPDANYTPEAEEKKLLLHRDSQDQSAIEQPNIVDQFLFEAEKQSFEKFGKKISGVIEDEFRNLVLPQMEEVIKTFLATEKEKFADLAISQKPANGKGEKIFHIYDRTSGKDLIRFHVRVDHPPKQGYWFDFHYHTYHDHFQTHYALGKIYWDTNTPPNWMQ